MGRNPTRPAAEPPLDDAGRSAWAAEADTWCRSLRYRAWGVLGGIPILLIGGAVALDGLSGTGRSVLFVVIAAIVAVDLWLGLRWRDQAAEWRERVDVVRRERPG